MRRAPGLYLTALAGKDGPVFKSAGKFDECANRVTAAKVQAGSRAYLRPKGIRGLRICRMVRALHAHLSSFKDRLWVANEAEDQARIDCVIFGKFNTSSGDFMTHKPSEPRLSATVLLVRDRSVLEVLMVARHYQIDFAAGALVFPGGKANDEDSAEEWLDYTDGRFGPEQRMARITAIREAFEESGVLLARLKHHRGEGADFIGAEMAEKLAPFRAAVDRGEQSFLALIRDHDLVLALDTLIHFGHWITPVMMPKRFDTHFYLAQTPEAQIASHDGRETIEALWLNPLKALGMEAAGEATIIFPTRMNLVKLSRAKTCAQAIEDFGNAPIVTVLPKVSKTEAGEPCLIIPAEADYGQTVELLSNVNV